MVNTDPQLDIKDLHRVIIRRLNALASVTAAKVRDLRREVSKQVATAPANQVVRLSRELIKTGEIIPRIFAYELVHYHPAATKSLNSRNIVSLGQGIDSWAAVDTFACYLSGPAWREGQIPDSLIASWTRSKDRWWRRAAVVSTVALNNKARGGTGGRARTLRFCWLVIDDRDDMVVKACRGRSGSFRNESRTRSRHSYRNTSPDYTRES